MTNGSIGQTDIFSSLPNIVHDYDSKTRSRRSEFPWHASSAANSATMDIPSQTMIRK